MTWDKEKSFWLEKPDTHQTKLLPFKERGEKFLRTWLDTSLPKAEGKSATRLQLGIGFECDAETDEYKGAMISVTFNELEPIFFRPDEMQKMVDFLKEQFADDEDMRRIMSVDDFVACLENGIEESKKFEKDAWRH